MKFSIGDRVAVDIGVPVGKGEVIGYSHFDQGRGYWKWGAAVFYWGPYVIRRDNGLIMSGDENNLKREADD